GKSFITIDGRLHWRDTMKMESWTPPSPTVARSSPFSFQVLASGKRAWHSIATVASWWRATRSRAHGGCSTGRGCSGRGARGGGGGGEAAAGLSLRESMRCAPAPDWIGPRRESEDQGQAACA